MSLLSVALRHARPVRVALRHTARPRALASAASKYLEDDAPTAEAVAGLQELYKKDAAAANVSFKVQGGLTSGLRSTVNVRDKFSIPMDEPPGTCFGALEGWRDVGPFCQPCLFL